jgi:glycosyltransferase involved in cell wall biosynthesis
MKKEKSVLMVAYYFPPYANVSTVRTMKYCKYLPKFGWKPRVLTVDERYYQDRVLPLSSFELGETEVSRAPYFSFPWNIFCVKIFFPFIVLSYVVKHRHEIDVVYFSGSPFHPFILSIMLDVFLKKPAVLDFRDSWSINHGFDGRGVGSWFGKAKQWLTGKLEKCAIHFASSVIFATSVLQQEYEELYPEYKSKYQTIPNGYDPNDFLDIEPVRIVDKTTLVLAGQFNIYAPKAVSSLMEALKKLPNLHFIYIGNEADVIREEAIAYSVNKSVTTFPYLPYDEVLQYVAGADFALLATGMRNGMGTKIFDYLALGKTTLCLVPKGSVVTRQFANLESVIISEPPYTIASLTKSIEELLLLKDKTAESGALRGFSRIEGADKLANTFNEVVKG